MHHKKTDSKGRLPLGSGFANMIFIVDEHDPSEIVFANRKQRNQEKSSKVEGLFKQIYKTNYLKIGKEMRPFVLFIDGDY